jgi:hypothetical protein|tara:strand:+ start:94 stop:948 length:855 start_codon:yes stop_codon:yes gene_type:complete
MRTLYRNGNPPYTQDSLNVMSLDASSNPPEDDPIAKRLEADRFALEYSNMREEAYDQYIIPDPRETGQINPDRSYIVEAVGLLGAPASAVGKKVAQKAATSAGPKVVKRGGNAEIDAIRQKVFDDFSKRMGNKRMLDEQQQRIAQDRLDYITDRLLNEAKTEDMVEDLNLQGQLTDLLEAAANEEKDRVDQILMDFVSDETTKRDLRDQINSLAELLSGRSGGETGSLLSESGKDFLGMGSQSMTEYLANPSKFDKVAGYPRLPYDITKPASRNEFGGKIRVIK